MINVCDADKTKGIYKIGYLFAFLGSATTCRCCLGMRVALAFILGLVLGLVTLYDVILASALIFMFCFTIGIFFTIWILWNKEQEEQDDEEEPLIFDTDNDYLDYIVDGLEKIYGRVLDQDEEEVIYRKFHEFKYQGKSGFQTNSETGAPIMAQWIKILESGKSK